MTPMPPEERRAEPRHSLSLPVWWEGGSPPDVHHGWMLDVSGRGAAMLTSRAASPAVGERLNISLVEPDLNSGGDIAGHLLNRVTVLRLDPVTPSLNRVAMHFSPSAWAKNRDPLMADVARMVEERIKNSPGCDRTSVVNG
jgi:hypothetical protein